MSVRVWAGNISLEADRVVAFHPYRTGMPWYVPGAVRVLHVDAMNMPPRSDVRTVSDPDSREVRDFRLDFMRTLGDQVREAKLGLVEACLEAGVRAFEDNHCAFDLEAGGLRYRAWFSDSSLYVWLLPPG